MIKKGNIIAVILNLLCVMTGLWESVFLSDNLINHNLFVWFVTFSLIFTVIYDFENMIRPMSYFILSFFIFVWMRILLNSILKTSVITVGAGITDLNIQKTTLFLGITMCAMTTGVLVTESILNQRQKDILLAKSKIYISPVINALLVSSAIICFLLFLLDSIKKIEIMQAHDYLNVSENIMLLGVHFFRFGKYFLLLWILIGKSEKRIFVASTILLLASAGYLMRGARGYAICYFFLWLLLFIRRHKIKFINLMLIGFLLIILANSILEYRLGFSISSGVFDMVVKTLHSQGASVEPVFGAVNFKDTLLEVFPKNEILSRGDFGNYIDDVRGVNFEAGGFSTSFFAELYFIGMPGGILFAGLLSLCVGVMEHAFKCISRFPDKSNYYMILIFMTCPNLIYFARSNIRDYIFKSLTSYMILTVLIYLACRKTGLIGTIGPGIKNTPEKGEGIYGL